MSLPRVPSIFLARLLSVALPILFGVLPACSKGEEPEKRTIRPVPPIPVHYSRLDRGTQPARLVGRLRVPEQLAPWVAEAPHARVVPLPGADSAEAQVGVLLPGKSSKVLRIPGAFQPEAFNRVVVELASRVEVHGELRFVSEGRKNESHAALLGGGYAETRELRFDAGGLPLMRQASTQLRLELTSTEPCFVASVSFWNVPFDEFSLVRRICG